MSDPGRAVFLSYSSQDAEAARRIADALRAFGVVVWFDQSELRGGDAWDQKIRKQIHECTLFLPVISATTQERGEGYFRREWKLAVERMQDLAEGVPFVVPVVVDDIAEAVAVVPDAFRSVQWTRLPHGVPTPQFVEQVKRLLATPHKPEVQRSEVRGQKSESRAARVRSGLPGWAWGALAVVVIGGIAGAFFATRQSAPAPPTQAPAADKSIAVLPFTNLSLDPGNAYFTDGVHEDILTNLAVIGELHVISRTSVMQYRGTTKTMRQIGTELGVAYLLEGSVRRAGTRLRVTAQLINARTDEHMWAKTYDRELTDVFAIQSELATEIAGALQARLNQDERKVLASAPTTSVKAYELVLQVRDLLRQPSGRIGRRRAQQLLEAALAEDPKFLQAWIALVEVFSRDVGQMDRSVDTAALAQAEKALTQARQLAPNDPWVSFAEATYYYMGARVFPRALEYAARARAVRPTEPEFLGLQARIERRMGRLNDAVPRWEEALRLDPLNVALWREISESYHLQRRFLDAAEAATHLVVLEPRQEWTLDRIGFRFLATADTKLVDEYEREWRGLPAGSRAFRGFERSLPGLQLWEWKGDRPALTREAAVAGTDITPIERLDWYLASSAGVAAARRWCVILALLAENESGLARALAEAHVRAYGELVVAPRADRVGVGEWLAMGATWYHLVGQDGAANNLLDRLKSLDQRETDAYWRAYRIPLLLPIWVRLEPDQATAKFLQELDEPMSFVSLDEIAASHWLYRPLLIQPRVKALLVKQGKWLPYLAERVPEYAEFKSK